MGRPNWSPGGDDVRYKERWCGTGKIYFGLSSVCDTTQFTLSTRVCRIGHINATGRIVARSVILDIEQLELIRVAFGTVLAVPWHGPRPHLS